MCGIAGSLCGSDSPRVDLRAAVRRMTDSMYRRGPDGSGVWLDESAGVGLGHRRLAVLDLSAAGDQPMVSACGRYVIVFNGEIYNHAAIRQELDAGGCSPRWRGHSDTETLLAGVAAWGLAVTLRKAAGMFALAVWDREARTLLLARDRIGEKPLYFGWAAGTFLFGSELKALRAHPSFDCRIDRNALAAYFQYTAVPAPCTIYEGIRKVEPGTIVTIPAGARMHDTCRIESYWSLRSEVQRGASLQFADEAEALRALEDSLRTSIALQSVADVPLGAFLSGGIDSSTIVALMQSQASRPIQTFTIGFDEEGFDESPYARAVARHLGTDHHELRVRPADAKDVIPLLPTLYDEPFADSSQIPTHLVCRAARKNVTVALSGDGGDELFGGYNRYIHGRKLWKQLGMMPFALRKAIGLGAGCLSHQAWDRIGSILRLHGGASRFGSKVHRVAGHLKSIRGPLDLHRVMLTEWPVDANIVIGGRVPPTRLDLMEPSDDPQELENQMMLWDALFYLPDDILTKVDRAAMGVSLETRAPFLDHRVVEVAWRMPLHMKIRDGQSKWALRQILYRHVPQELIDRPKAGFMIPVGEWLRDALRDWAESLLDEGRLRADGYLNVDLVRATWQQHCNGTHNWTARLWAVLMFQSWLQSTSGTSPVRAFQERQLPLEVGWA